jgi:hypothetical protein
LHRPTSSFGWRKTKLERREYNREDEVNEAEVEMLIDHLIELIETVFIDRMNRRQLLLDGNGDYVSQNITSESLN